MGFGLLFIIIVAFVLLFDGGAIIKRLLNNSDATRSIQVIHPREILDARLARGEIDLVEYKNIRKHLEGTKVME